MTNTGIQELNSSALADEFRFKNILVPVDGSGCGDEACDLAVNLARKIGAQLHVIYVMEPLSTIDPEHVRNYVYEIDKIREVSSTFVKEKTSELKEKGDSKVTGVLLEGYPAEVIVKYVSENKIDLIVMGTHGRRGLRRMFLGSTTEEVLRTAAIPVLVTRHFSDV